MASIPAHLGNACWHSLSEASAAWPLCWEALLRVPSGYVVSYEDVAVQIGMPRAARAVGNAIARNPIPVIIPCHRVIHKGGDFGGYSMGTARKKAILGWEAAQNDLRLQRVEG